MDRLFLFEKIQKFLQKVLTLYPISDIINNVVRNNYNKTKGDNMMNLTDLALIGTFLGGVGAFIGGIAGAISLLKTKNTQTKSTKENE